MKHTPGKWYVEGINPPRIYAKDGLNIIAQCDSHGEMTSTEELANARLIAAAPEMYELLKWYQENFSPNEMHDAKLDALLSKIESKSARIK